MTTNYSTIPAFVANPERADVLAGGYAVDFVAFAADVVPAGTIVSISEDGVVPAADGETAYVTVATAYKAPKIAMGDCVSLIHAGEIYEDRLPQAVAGVLPAPLRALILANPTIKLTTSAK